MRIGLNGTRIALLSSTMAIQNLQTRTPQIATRSAQRPVAKEGFLGKIVRKMGLSAPTVSQTTKKGVDGYNQGRRYSEEAPRSLNTVVGGQIGVSKFPSNEQFDSFLTGIINGQIG